MNIEADYTITIKLKDIIMSGPLTDQEINEKVIEEGDKKLRYYLSGFLSDPNKKIIDKQVSIKIKNS